MRRDAEGVGLVLHRISDLVDRAVGHRIDFDLAILGRERRARGRPGLGNVSLCTMRLAAALHPRWPDVGPDAVADQLGIPIPDRHTAR